MNIYFFNFRPGIDGQKGAPGEYGNDGVCIDKQYSLYI